MLRRKAGDLEATVKELPTMKASGKRREENQLRHGTIYASNWSSRREADTRELPTGWRSHVKNTWSPQSSTRRAAPSTWQGGLEHTQEVARRGPAGRLVGAQCS